MQQALPHRITAVVMAVLLLSTSVSFSMDMHFCQGKLKSINLLGKAKPCHDIAKTPTCPFHKAAQKNCCNNKEVTIEQSDDDYNTSSFSLEINQVQSVVSPSTLFLPQVAQASFTNYLHYKPPIPDRDRLVLYQIFLI